MKINKIYIILIIILVLINLGSSSLQNLLIEADSAFVPDEASFELKLIFYSNTKKKNEQVFESYVKGNDKYLLFSIAPPVQRGLGQLRIGAAIYSYDKRIDKLSTVSAKSAFFNTILSQEDIMSTNLSTFYKVEKKENITINGKDVISLHLVGKSKKVAYYRIILNLEKETLKPISRKYFSYSKKLIKEMEVNNLEYDSNNNIQKIKMTIKDSLRDGSYVEVYMDNFQIKKFPNNMFTQIYLKNNVK